MQPDNTDSDVFETSTVELMSQPISFDRGREPVERAVGIDFTGLGIDRKHNVTITLREFLRRRDQRRVAGAREFRHWITSCSSSTALEGCSA
jgi:hypothetical protein